MKDCPFCKDNWSNLNHVDPYKGRASVTIIRPLHPVTKGHVLVISEHHTIDAAANPKLTAELMFHAATYVRRRGLDANIITSIGSDATQTVFHTHLHVVPRQFEDGLTLPWTGQEVAAI